MNEPRTYKQPIFGVFLSLVMLLFAGTIIFFTFDSFDTNFLWFLIPLLGIFGLVFLTSLFSYTSKVTITDDEISSQILFIPKTLRWTEINRASGSGNGIKLHNEDTTVSINSRLPGLEEIVETIGQKRADLFSAQEFSEMRRGFGSYLFSFIVFLMFAGVGVLYITVANFSADSLLPMGFIALFMLIFLWGFLSSPHSLTLENNNLQIKYLLNEKNFTADEISNILFTFSRSRRGRKQYYVAINSKDGKSIRVAGLNIGLPVAYLVLKNWHKKFSS